MSYGKILFTTEAVTQDILSGVPLVLQDKEFVRLWNSILSLEQYILGFVFYTLSGCIGKVVASHAAVVRSIPAEVALI